ncbi:MAG TPA: ribosomal-processing cysteine protease Prp [Oscillospiraceae bacterium]|nr:ribosomal-processing cysteine protease Prp [Oscillospiraceae bacterium]
MITAEFFKKDGKMRGFFVRGHAGYADKGEDIVCASVSSAVQLSANLITECFKSEANVEVEGDGIRLSLDPLDGADAASKVIEGLLLHLELLSDDFKGTIKVIISEV